jgi:hypothetical protein
MLEFAHGQRMEYPRDGLYLFGPCDSEKRPKSTRYGVIGTREGIERFARLSARMRGYIPMGPETPNPILVRVQRGACDLRVVLSDVLGLTKINFNSCLFNDRLPVTIKFANEVGDVLISAPMDGEPRLPFKFYI